MKLIFDSREKNNIHILKFYKENNISRIRQKLDFGDYTFEGLENKIVIERKSGLNEITINFTKKRKQFINEMERAAAAGAKIILLIENTSQEDIINHNYRSKMHPNSLLGSLRSWQKKYDLEVYFLKDSKFSAQVIYYFLKTYLKNNNNMR